MTDGQTPNRWLELVSDRVGIIKSLSWPARGADEPTPPWVCCATLSHFDFRKAGASDRVAGGKAPTASEAMAGAIGEAIEHYCAAHFDEDRTRRAAWTAINQSAIAPREFVLYSDSQYARRDFPYHRWAPDDEIRWMPACELPGDSPVLVPASLVYLVGQTVRPEEFFCVTTSSGLAAGTDLKTAVLSGLYELIERDGFLIHWMTRLPAPELEFEGSLGMAGSIRSHYARFGVKVRVFNVSTNLPAYVMMAIAMDNGGGPAVLVGLGCHLDPGLALLKSLMEVCQIRPGQVQRFREKPPGTCLKKYEDVRTLDDHSDFAAMPEHVGEFDFLLANGRCQKLEDLPVRATGAVHSDLATCVEALARLGHRTLYADVTTEDVAEYDFGGGAGLSHWAATNALRPW